MSAQPHPAIAIVAQAAATLATDAGAGVGYVQVTVRRTHDGPTRAQLEATFGPANQLPRIAGPAFSRLAFPGPAGGTQVSLFADVDDETGRATTLMARRDDL